MRIGSLYTVYNFGKLLIVVASVMLILTSCTSKKRKDFNLEIVVSDKLGEDKNQKLPQEIINLCLPIEDCAEFNLVPSPTLYRLGYEKSTAEPLGKKVKGGFAGNPDNPRLIRREIERHLSTITIGKVFVQPKHPSVNLKSSLDSYLDTIGKKSLIVFYSTMESQEDTYRGISIYSSIDSVQKRIAEEVCEKGLSSVFVFINPPIKPSTIVVPHPEYPPSENNAEEEVAREIVQKGSLSDWRTTYELMKNRIYGKEHHEVFDLLRKATEMAIEQGEARYLLDRINEEKDTALKRLSRGHPDEWNPIIEALEHNDISRLHAHE